MKKSILYGVVAVVIAGGLYYYLVMLPKQRANSTESTEKNSSNQSIESLKAKGYNAEEIAQIVESDSWKNGTGNW